MAVSETQLFQLDEESWGIRSLLKRSKVCLLASSSGRRSSLAKWVDRLKTAVFTGCAYLSPIPISDNFVRLMYRFCFVWLPLSERLLVPSLVFRSVVEHCFCA